MNATRVLSRTFVVLAGTVLLFGCSKEPAEKEPVVSVQTATAERASIKEVVSTEAVLNALHQAAITPKITAPVQKFYVNRGARVHKGQLLAVLENRDLAAAQVENKGTLEQAEADYQRATSATIPEELQKARLDEAAARKALDAQEKIYISRENLFKQGALPRKEFDQAGVDLTNARNQYELAQKHLAALEAGGHQQQLKSAAGQLASAKGKYLASEAQFGYSEIRSPIDGYVTDRPAYPGEMPQGGAPLITVMDTSEVIARAHIPQEQAVLLKPGDPATITAPGLDEEVPAKVTVVSPALDPNSTTVEIWVQARNPKQQLKPGETVRLSMVARTVPDATVVPASALLSGEGRATTVMLVGDDGRAHKQEVEVGIRSAEQAQIIKGLKPGQRVVTAGAYGLPDNTKVRIAQAAEQKPAEDDKKDESKDGSK